MLLIQPDQDHSENGISCTDSRNKWVPTLPGGGQTDTTPHVWRGRNQIPREVAGPSSASCIERNQWSCDLPQVQVDYHTPIPCAHREVLPGSANQGLQVMGCAKQISKHKSAPSTWWPHQSSMWQICHIGGAAVSQNCQ
jgi:hypothetical protein